MKTSAFALVVVLTFGLSAHQASMSPVRPDTGASMREVDESPSQTTSASTWIARAGSGGNPPFENPTLRLRRASLRGLIGIAHATTHARMSGGPAWMDEPEWDVAVLADRTAPYSAVREMLRDMLASRFQLRVTPTARRVSALILSFENAASTEGLRPARAKIDCTPFLNGVRSPVDAPRDADGFVLCGPSTVRKGLHLRSAPLDAFARDLEILLGQVVVVSPPRAGLFDIDFAWPRGYAEHDPDPDLDAFMTAVERQLGAAPQVRSTDVQILVVAGAARPTLGVQ